MGGSVVEPPVFFKKPENIPILMITVCFGQHAVCSTLESGVAHYELPLFYKVICKNADISIGSHL
jgi:hypothetical protein